MLTSVGAHVRCQRQYVMPWPGNGTSLGILANVAAAWTAATALDRP